MNLIEQATRRLEELRRSGVEVPGVLPPGASVANVANAKARHAKQAPASVPYAPARPPVSIDLQRLAQMGYVTPDKPRTKIADEFRVIKRPLLNNLRDEQNPIERANVIMITSALPGEGKTFVAINLAISMALELDYSVTLVDADVLRSSVLNRLLLEPVPGLLDALTDPSVDVEERLLPTTIEKLSILGAGMSQRHATELLASEQMDQLLAALATRDPNRIIVMDAPPLLPTTEARVLARRVGQVVMVVEAGRTLRPAIEEAAAALEECPVVLPLLNKISTSEVGSYGHYEPIEK